jgi:hypothetical protein
MWSKVGFDGFRMLLEGMAGEEIDIITCWNDLLGLPAVTAKLCFVGCEVHGQQALGLVDCS